MSGQLQRRGNSIYILIREYMKKNLSIYLIIIYLLFQNLLKEYNITLLNHIYDKIYDEKYVLDELEYYIKEIKYNENLLKDISKGILPKYIDNDNKRLKKILRKILVIKKRYIQKKLLIYVNKWLFNINNSLKDGKELICINEKNKKIIDNTRNNKPKVINSKFNIKQNFHNSYSISYKNNEKNKNKNKKNSMIVSNKTSPDSFKGSQFSSFHNNQTIKNKKNERMNSKIKQKNIHKSYSMTKDKKRVLSDLMPQQKENKTPNKKKNQSMITDFMNNLIINEKNKEEKMKKLNIKHEEKINSVYTFSPQLCKNKNNEKYLKNMVNKLYEDNNKDNNNMNMSDNYDNNESKLDIVMEENRDFKDINFFSRLDEYEKRRLNNLEKIKNDILVNEYKNKNLNFYKNNNEKYNIIDDHLLISSYSYSYNKKRIVEKLLENINEEKGITFSPKLNNKYNNRIKNNFKNLKEDLLNKRNERIYNYLTDRDKECTFQPRINNVYNINIMNNRNTVGERLLSYQDKYNNNLITLKNNYPRYSFKPKISKNKIEILNKKKINNLKEKIKFNIMFKSKRPKFEEKKDSLKIDEAQKRLENYKINYTPSFEFSKRDKNNHIEYDDINVENMIEYKENSNDSKNDINNKSIESKKQFAKNKNKNLMIFDYYDKLI